MPLSSDSTKVLEQVKKSGKPCKFVLVSKGAKVISVVAFRKGSDDARIREAKEEGSGTVSVGTVDYPGNLSFKLLRSDGYEAPPVKATALKEYLNEGTGLNSKPTIDIVDVLPAVELEGEGPTPNYRTGEAWKAILAEIQQTPDGQVKAALLLQAARDCKTESDQVKQDLQTNPNLEVAKAQEATLAKVAEILKQLGPARQMPPMPQLPPTPPPRQPQPQAPLRPQTPTPQRPMPPVPLTPPRKKLNDLLGERRAIALDVQQRVQKAKEFKSLYGQQGIDTILQECETDANSDFGLVISKLDLGLMTGGKTPRPREAEDGRLLDGAMKKLIAAKTAAQSYIKDHKDPKIGSLPTRVKKRRQYCEQFVKEIDDYIKFIGDRNGAALEMCETYEKKVLAGEYVPPDVVRELEGLLTLGLLTDDTKGQIRKTMALLAQETQKLGYQELAKVGNLSKTEKVDLLEAYGCGSKPGGGTSDVKLLRDNNGNILYAVKSAAKESEDALGSLGLPNGACAMREDVASTVFEKLQELTSIDIGFPKSELMLVNGQPCAVIDGIRGKMADREEVQAFRREKEKIEKLRKELVDRQRPQEEIQHMDDMLTKIDQKLAGAIQDREEIPDKVSAKSLSKVLMSSVLTAQWDLKWGNMIVEGDTARPIDAGAGFPTLKTLDGFLTPNHTALFGVPALEQLVMYPGGHSKEFQDLPIANQPVDQELVDSMLQLNVDTLVQAAKDRRDQLKQQNPGLGGGTELLDDLSLKIMKESIEGTKAILTQKNPITLKEFVVAWTAWFTAWAPKFYQDNAPPT